MACLDDDTVLQFSANLLPPDQKREVETHIATCDSCRWLVSAAASDDENLTKQETVPDAVSELVSSEERDRRIGRLIKQTYRIESLLGEGGMGVVYRATHVSIEQKVAIKFLSANTKQARSRLRREAEITCRLKHPNIVQVYDFDFQEDGTPFIVIEYLEGETLAALLKRERLLPEDRAVEILRQMFLGISAAHRAGVVHRDLNPRNVFICPAPEGGDLVKVLDFGISKVLSDDDSITASVAWVGTPRYMAPEQAKGASARVDHRTDIYAAGIVAYELLTGASPFAGSTMLSTLIRIAQKPPSENPRFIALPAFARQALLKALAKDPDERFQSAGAFYQALTGTADLSVSGTFRSFAELGDVDDRTWVDTKPWKKSYYWAPATALLAFVLAVFLFFILKTEKRPEVAVSTVSPPIQEPIQTPPVQTQTAAPLPEPSKLEKKPASEVEKTEPRIKPRRIRKRTPRTGSLSIQSKSASDGRHLWASVFIDGEPAGKTPLIIKKLAAGVHRIQIRRPGYRTVTKRVRVRPGKSTRRAMELERL